MGRNIHHRLFNTRHTEHSGERMEKDLRLNYCDVGENEWVFVRLCKIGLCEQGEVKLYFENVNILALS